MINIPGMIRCSVVITISLLLNGAIGSGQSIVTDRPDQTESALTIPKSHFQIETGTFVETVGSAQTWHINSTLFRYGLTEAVELRLASSLSKSRKKYSNDSAIEISGFDVGSKLQIIKSTAELAALIHVVAPVSLDGEWETQLALLFAVPIQPQHDVSLGINAGISYDKQDELTPYFTTALSFGLTDRISFYTEVYGNYNNELNLSYDHGLTYLLKENLQFDFSMGTGITNSDKFVSIGFSWRTQ